MSYHVVAIGPKHEPDLRAMIESYETRLSRFGGVTWVLLPYASRNEEITRRDESFSIAQKLKDDDYVILLDERGQELTSTAFATRIDNVRSSSRRIVFVIGGAYGVDDTVQSRADLIWSLSPLVFPHQIVRLLLVEQLYRAHMILEHHPYHH